MSAARPAARREDRMRRRLRFAARTLLSTALLLWGVSFAAFLLLALSPVDPLATNVGQAALGSMSEAQVERLETYWGVDTPPLERYRNWLSGALRGDLGTSLLYRQPVVEVIGERLAASAGLLIFAWLCSGALGLALGVAAGVWRGRWPDRLIRGGCLLLASTPSFWLALLASLLFSVWLGWLPAGLAVPIGTAAEDVTLLDRLRHAVLPALTLTLAQAPQIALHTREKTGEILSSDYVLYARARGEGTGAIVRRHVLRNATLPALTLQFASIGEIVGGSALVEQAFSYPGLGQAAVTAGLGGDLPLLLGVTLATAALVSLGSLASDLLCGAVDPRIRRGRDV